MKADMLFFLLLFSIPFVTFSFPDGCSISQVYEESNETFVVITFDNIRQLTPIECSFCPPQYYSTCASHQDEYIVESIGNINPGKHITTPSSKVKTKLRSNSLYDFDCFEDTGQAQPSHCPSGLPLTVITKSAAPVVQITSPLNSSNITLLWNAMDYKSRITLSYDICTTSEVVPCFSVTASSSQQSAPVQLPKDGKGYQITVYSVNKAGRGTGGSVSVTTPMTPPTNVLFGESTSSSIEVKWIMEITFAKIQYKVCLFNSEEAICELLISPTNLSQVFSSLQSNTPYYANVTAIGEQNEAVTNSSSFAFTTPNPVEIACRNETVSGFSIEWNDATNHVEQISYSIQYSTIKNSQTHLIEIALIVVILQVHLLFLM